jgi:DEAD/DEAH box helicase domain-containing protein
MDSRQKFREAYIGAIYTHFGATYKVVAHGEGEVILEHAEPYLKSRPYFYSVVSVNDTITGLDFDGGLSIFYGKLTIFENMQRHVVIDTRTDETVDEVPSNETFRKFAHGFWIDFACGSKQGENREQGALSAEQLIRIGLPFVLACDRHDIDTFSELTDKADENAPATIYVAEGVPGGIGIAQKCFEKWEDILRCGIEIAEECSCRKGCPTCIYPPRIRSADKLDKRIGIETAKAILADAETGAKARFDPATHGWFTG